MPVQPLRRLVPPFALVGALFMATDAAAAALTPLAVSVAASAASDDHLASYYRSADYAPLWVGPLPHHRARREALLASAGNAAFHGLPVGRYDLERIRERIAAARTERERGALDVDLSRIFLRLASDLRSGVLDPASTIPSIKRNMADQDRASLLRRFERARPHEFLRSLVPSSPEYARLAREKFRLEQAADLADEHEDPVPVKVVQRGEGATGADVVSLRDRLSALGYLERSALDVFDHRMRQAIAAFQTDHGLSPDGIVGERTISELNIGPETRLGQVLVAMERERWLNLDRGETHVWVNLTEFRAKIVRDDAVVFQTKAIIGRADADRQTPEFSDRMEHMVINPYWYVPRSIIVDEYLPGLRSNPYAFGELQIIDRRGREVNRAHGFGHYTSSSFPFSMRQPPGPQNALGRVKFIFPNRYNIYLHDTPGQHLFSQTVRAFSHGCIRLDEPYEFAYALLAMQSDDPEGDFHRHLATGRASQVDLEKSLPVHLVYRTAFTKPEGGMQYREDIYGRDARILAALMAEGVRYRGIDRRLALSKVDG